MGIVDIGQQIPSILFRTIEEEFLDGTYTTDFMEGFEKRKSEKK